MPIASGYQPMDWDFRLWNVGAGEYLVGELVGEVQLRDRVAIPEPHREMDVHRPARVPARIDRVESAHPTVVGALLPRRNVSDGATTSRGTDSEVTT